MISGDQRAERERVERGLEDHRAGEIEAQRVPAPGVADPQQEAGGERGVEHEVRGARAGGGVHRAGHEVGAVDPAGEQDADLVGEDERKDQHQAGAEVAVAGEAVRGLIRCRAAEVVDGARGPPAAAGSRERLVRARGSRRAAGPSR